MTTEQTINDLLARFEAVETIADYFTVRSLTVQALNSYEYGVGVGPNRSAQWDRFERIDAGKRPMIQAEYRSIPALSLEELCEPPVNLLTAVQAQRALTASQATITDMICAAVYASTSIDSVREGEEHQMEVAVG